EIGVAWGLARKLLELALYDARLHTRNAARLVIPGFVAQQLPRALHQIYGQQKLGCLQRESGDGTARLGALLPGRGMEVVGDALALLGGAAQQCVMDSVELAEIGECDDRDILPGNKQRQQQLDLL